MRRFIVALVTIATILGGLATVPSASAVPAQGGVCGIAQAPFPTSLVPPSWTGKLKVGSIIRIKVGTWDPSADRITFQWKRDMQGPDVPIPGATKRYYKIKPADKGHGLSVSITVYSKECPKPSKSGFAWLMVK